MKKRELLKFLAAGVVASTTPAIYAQDVNIFQERDRLIAQYGLKNSVTMGWYAGAVDTFEVRALINRFLPLSNYLSRQLGVLVILEADRSDREIAKDADIGNLDIVYTSGLMASQLVKKGWVPIVGRSDGLRPVVVGLTTTKADTSADLKGKKISGAVGATVTAHTQYSLLVDGVIKDINDPNFEIIQTGQQQLIELVKTKKSDGIIVRDIVGERLVKQNPQQFKILYRGKPAPGHVLLVSPNFPLAQRDLLRDLFINLRPTDAQNKKILSGLDGYQESDLQPFKVVGLEDLKISEEVFTGLKEKPL